VRTKEATIFEGGANDSEQKKSGKAYTSDVLNVFFFLQHVSYFLFALKNANIKFFFSEC